MRFPALLKILTDARINPSSPHARLIRYGLSVIGVMVVTLISLAGRPFFEPNPFLLPLVAVALVIWYSGFRPGMLAALLSLVSVNYFLISDHSFHVEPVDFLRLVLFMTVVLVLSWPYISLRRAEERLRIADERLRTALKGSPIVIFNQDRDLRYTWIQNSRFNLPPEQILGKRTVDLIPAEEAEVVDKLKQQVIETGVGVRQEVQFNYGGLVHSIDHIIEPLYDAAGQIIGVTCVDIDLTDRKQAETILAQAHAETDQERLRLKTVLQALPVGVFIADANGRMIEMNDQVTTIWGEAPYSTNIDEYAVYKARWADTGEMITADTWALARALRNGEVSVGEVVHIERFDGKRGTILNSAAPIYDSNGALLGAVVVLMDITERVRIEEALQLSEERFRIALKNSPVTVFNQNCELRYTWIYNSSIGLENNDVFGKQDIDLMERREDALNVTVLKQHVLDTGIGAREEISIYNGDERHFYDLTIEPLCDAQGQIIGITCASMDITERKKAEAEIKSLNVELEQRVLERTAQLAAVNQELEAFSYSVSHDLRTPLRAINGFSQALLEDYGDRLDGDGKYFLDRVRAASERMGQLIDVLLDLSRVTRNPMQLGHVNLSEMAHQIIYSLQEAQPERQISVEIQNGLVVAGDRRLLEVMMQNVLENAWKFTGKVAAPRIEFGVLERQEQPVYFVRDNGAGFDMAYVSKLFGAFQRLHHISEFEGIGIGLATVQRIVHRHGGQVWAESAPNEGATFYFTLTGQRQPEQNKLLLHKEIE